jgi:cell wall-associated NlpC family hydrolase
LVDRARSLRQISTAPIAQLGSLRLARLRRGLARDTHRNIVHKAFDVIFKEVFADVPKSLLAPVRTVNFAILLLWLLTASLGWADENASDHHRAKKSSGSEDSQPTVSSRHRKHSIQKSDSGESETPEPTAKKGSTTESSKEPSSQPGPSPAPASVATMKPENIREFKNQPPQIQQLLREALALTEQNLTYKYGSADPSAGGMDCSGFIYYVLTKSGFRDVPRDSSEQYAWIRQNSNFHAVLSRDSQSFEFRELKPGDLMFWTGTYRVSREIPVSHVMIYLGTEKSTKKPVMVGASDGRSYDGVRRNGVSVFDFKMPSGQPNSADPDLIARFEGYGTIPGLREPAPANEAKNFSESNTEQKAGPTPKKKEKPLSNGD